tara:strand:- start:539 stop:736 length:198 start_codon:yes stop_codon:yes gene_type:complete
VNSKLSEYYYLKGVALQSRDPEVREALLLKAQDILNSGYSDLKAQAKITTNFINHLNRGTLPQPD